MPLVSDHEQLSKDLEARNITVRQNYAEIKFLKASLNRANSFKNAIKMALEADMNHANNLQSAIKNALETDYKENPAARIILGQYRVFICRKRVRNAI